MSCDRESKNGDMRNILPRREMTQFCVLGPYVKCVRAAVSTSQLLFATDCRSARTIVSVLSIDASVDSAVEPNDPGAHQDRRALASGTSSCHESPARLRAQKKSRQTVARRSPPDGPTVRRLTRLGRLFRGYQKTQKAGRFRARRPSSARSTGARARPIARRQTAS
jgi:hypothetical protein